MIASIYFWTRCTACSYHAHHITHFVDARWWWWLWFRHLVCAQTYKAHRPHVRMPHFKVHRRPQDFFFQGGTFPEKKLTTFFSLRLQNTGVDCNCLIHKTLYNISRVQVPPAPACQRPCKGCIIQADALNFIVNLTLSTSHTLRDGDVQLDNIDVYSDSSKVLLDSCSSIIHTDTLTCML